MRNILYMICLLYTSSGTIRNSSLHNVFYIISLTYPLTYKLEGDTVKIGSSINSVSYTHLEENQEAKVVLTAINVEGSEVTQTFDFHIVRPQIPEAVSYTHLVDAFL